MDKLKVKEVFHDLLKAYYTLKLETLGFDQTSVDKDQQQQLSEEIIGWDQRFKQSFYGTREGFVDECIEKILEYQRQIDLTEKESLERAYLLAEQNVFIGRLASELSREYKMVYAHRKRVQAEARIRATKDKEAHSELAVKDLREEEADAYGDMIRYKLAFESTKEQIHAIKIKHRITEQSWSDQGHGS